MLEALVKVGRLRQPEPGRRRRCRGRAKLFGAVDSAIEHGSRTQRDRDQGQADLFGGGDDGVALSIIRLPDAAPWTEMELLAHEKEALGLYLSGHPIDRYAETCAPFGAAPSAI